MNFRGLYTQAKEAKTSLFLFFLILQIYASLPKSRYTVQHGPHIAPDDVTDALASRSLIGGGSGSWCRSCYDAGLANAPAHGTSAQLDELRETVAGRLRQRRHKHEWLVTEQILLMLSG